MAKARKSNKTLPAFSVKIRGMEWLVYSISPKKMKELTGDAVYLGLCAQTGKRIYLRNTQPFDLLLRTFLHEYAHAILGVVSENPVEGISPKVLEEIFCDSFGEYGAELLAQREYIMGELQKIAAAPLDTIQGLQQEIGSKDGEEVVSNEDSDG